MRHERRASADGSVPAAWPLGSQAVADAARRGDPVSLARYVKEQARTLGFHLVGITGAQPFEDDERRALAWLEAGGQTDMAWLHPDRMRLAARPRDLLPGARSIIVLGVSYRADGGAQPRSADGYASTPGAAGAGRGRECPAAPNAAANPAPVTAHRTGGPGECESNGHGPDAPARAGLPSAVLRGRIARYAGGTDYHDVFKPRMRALVERLAAHPDVGAGVRARLCVDSSPLLERAAAVRAGLGFFGKNSLLLAPGGSYTLLGAIITDADLAPDAPSIKDCGSCRLCLDACPTGALTDGHTVDAGRCISYLTIELRGPIPRPLRPKMGDWVFGCDVCQAVCPWNRGRGPLTWPELAPRPAPGPRPDLPALLALDQAAFSAGFRGSPIKRAKRRGLLRNAAVALGNSGDPAAIPALVRALADPEPLVRGHAAWALGHLGGAAAEAALRGALALEIERDVRAELNAALQDLRAGDTHDADAAHG